jgi:hypothetical protein
LNTTQEQLLEQQKAQPKLWRIEEIMKALILILTLAGLAAGQTPTCNRASGTQLTVTKGVVLFSATARSPNAATLNMGSFAGSTTWHVYITPAGALTLGHDGTGGLVSLTGAVEETGIATMPDDVMPVCSVAVASGVLSTTVQQYNHVMRKAVDLPGTNMTKTCVAGVCTWDGAAGGSTTIHTVWVSTGASDANGAEPATGWAYSATAGSSWTAAATGTSPHRISYVTAADDADRYMTYHWNIPSNWNAGAITLKPVWATDTGSNTASLDIATVCLAVGDNLAALTQTFNADQTISVTPTASARIYSSLALTTTGCAAGESMLIRIKSLSGDTNTGVAYFFGMEIVYTGTN